MTIELIKSNNAPRGLVGTSLGQRASQTKNKSMIRSDWHAMRGEPNASTVSEKKPDPEVVFTKTLIHREILKRLDNSA